MLAQIQACERLLKYAKEAEEIDVLKDEIAKLRLALDLVDTNKYLINDMIIHSVSLFFCQISGKNIN